jgi:exopolysaccharide biosynthesis protein
MEFKVYLYSCRHGYMKYLMITFLFSLNILSAEYVISSKKRSFTFTTSETSVHYKSLFQDLKVKTSSCTKRFITNLNNEIKQALKKKSLKTKQPFMLLKTHQKNYKLDPSSSLAQFFYNLRDRIIKMKLIEGKNCD